MATLAIRFHRGGVHLSKLGLWLDPHVRQTGPEKVFISHAHSDHIGAHREIILSAITARLMRARLDGERLEHALPFGEPASFDHHATTYQLTLLPAGHIFGSAMAFIETGGESVLYTGDFKLRHGLSAEACAPRRADVLIMETTFGRPQYCFPPREEVLAAMVCFCRDALADGATPVLLGYSLGKAQEILRALAGAGLPVMLHPQVQKMTRIYEQFGQRFPVCEEFNPARARGRVLVCPPGAQRSAALANVGKMRSAMLTGWAVDSSCRFRYQTDAAFPLSDHADFAELIELAQAVAPRKIYTLHGFAADFAQTLRDLGFDTQALSEPDQLGLPLFRSEYRL